MSNPCSIVRGRRTRSVTGSCRRRRRHRCCPGATDLLRNQEPVRASYRARIPCRGSPRPLRVMLPDEQSARCSLRSGAAAGPCRAPFEGANPQPSGHEWAPVLPGRAVPVGRRRIETVRRLPRRGRARDISPPQKISPVTALAHNDGTGRRGRRALLPRTHASSTLRTGPATD